MLGHSIRLAGMAISILLVITRLTGLVILMPSGFDESTRNWGVGTARYHASLLFQEQTGGDSDSGEVAPPGVNLVPIIRNFRIQNASFSSTSKDVQDGCVTPGSHRLLRFDTLMYNAGDLDLLIGAPSERPELFVWSEGHGHYHLVDFIEYQLYDHDQRQVVESYKQAICFFDSQRISEQARSTRQFSPGSCNTEQGLSAGWADLYRSSVTCQFIAIDDVSDGTYALTATLNPQGIVDETTRLDNSTCQGLRIEGNQVTETNSRFCQDWEILRTTPDQRSPEMAARCRFGLEYPCWE